MGSELYDKAMLALQFNDQAEDRLYRSMTGDNKEPIWILGFSCDYEMFKRHNTNMQVRQLFIISLQWNIGYVRNFALRWLQVSFVDKCFREHVRIFL